MIKLFRSSGSCQQLQRPSDAERYLYPQGKLPTYTPPPTNVPTYTPPPTNVPLSALMAVWPQSDGLLGILNGTWGHLYRSLSVAPLLFFPSRASTFTPDAGFCGTSGAIIHPVSPKNYSQDVCERRPPKVPFKRVCFSCFIGAYVETHEPRSQLTCLQPQLLLMTTGEPVSR